MRLYKAIVAGALSAAAVAATAVALPVLTEEPANAASGPGVTVNLWNWNWKSVAKECADVLGPAGYGSVQVSPPSDSMSKGGSVWWDIYQPARYDLTSKFGDQDAFRKMIDACHAAGVKVQVDTVINHMTGQGSTSYGGYGFSKYDYPGLYSSQDFHQPACGINDADYGNNAWRVQNCELVGLSDLNTGSDHVRDQIAAYLNKLIDLGVDGFRIDAAKHMSPDDLAAIKSRLKGSPYIHQEVIYGQNEAVQPSQYTGVGDVDEFVYGRKLKEQFTGQIKSLQTFGQSWGLSVGSDKAMVFVDNHDTERGDSTLTYKYGATYKLANTFMLAWPFGKPNVYSSFTWNDREGGPPSANGGFVTDTDCSNGRWTCFDREMSGMVGFYNAVSGTSVGNWTDNGSNLIAFSRGDRGWVAINNENSGVTRTFTTGLPAGTYPNVAGSGSVTVNAGGTATVTVPAKSAVAIRVGTSPSPTATPTPTPTPTGDSTATVFYKTSWSTANIHYGIGGTWTTVPGIAMDTACTGWKKKTVDLATATTFQVTFNNNSGTWDNNHGNNYTLGTGTTIVKDGVATANATDPCQGTNPQNTATVYYSTTWSTANIHYGIGGTWTTVPGIAMDTACTGWKKKTVDLATATTFQVTFNNNSGTWDNNHGNNYTLGTGTTTVKNGVATANATDPCGS